MGGAYRDERIQYGGGNPWWLGGGHSSVRDPVRDTVTQPVELERSVSCLCLRSDVMLAAAAAIYLL